MHSEPANVQVEQDKQSKVVSEDRSPDLAVRSSESRPTTVEIDAGAMPTLPGSKSSAKDYLELHYCPKELTKVALKTSVLVASLLVLPDAIAIIPQNQSVISWALAVLSLWLTALILWFVGFLGMMHLLRFSNGPLICDAKGIRGGRLDKLIPWDRVHAISVECAPVFSKIFGIDPPAKKLSIFHGKSVESRLEHKDIASFFYRREEFDTLTEFLASKLSNCNAADTTHANTGSQPAFGTQLLIVRDGKLDRMHGIFSLIKISRVLLSIVIAISLLAFLGRKALTHYTYNQANIYFSRAQYAYAETEYRNALSMDAAFPAGWHNLATCEYILGKQKDAVKHWKRALMLKPDMVEPKISLAQVAIEKRQFDKAETLLEPATRHAPNNKALMTKLAELQIAEGNEHRAIKTARQIITLHGKDSYSICLLAKSKIKSAKFDAASRDLQNIAERDRDWLWNQLYGECLLQAGKPRQAIQYLERSYKAAPKNIDSILVLASCKRALGDPEGSISLLAEAESINKTNPWVYLRRTQVEIDLKNFKAAQVALMNAIDKSKQQDLNSLELAGSLAESLGQYNLKKDLLNRSLKLSSHLDEKRTTNADFLIRELLFSEN
ncbi:MAG: tetratricopeptide repeat protein [Candidatus Obscuribacterales bacterium]|nr:tetratricopeptide repeat protein [Candidatus Obscuribacterales bacterium]